MKALISVYDKSGIADFAYRLHQVGFELVSTGGTHGVIQEANLPVNQVSEITGSPEILGGRVKTLHPVIHGGILARRDKEEHSRELQAQGIDTIDIVIVNLYPFAETVAKPDVTLEEALENIDIGGPTMIRAAAKNFTSVLVVVDPEDYSWVAAKIIEGTVTFEDRRNLAFKAFQHVAVYDSLISDYLQDPNDNFPDKTTFAYSKLYDLRYGENPHQKAAFYSDLTNAGIASARLLHGKELSYNNILDADAAWKVVSDFDVTAVAVIKHTNTCGLACHDDQVEAYERAFAGDPVSAFGGIVAFNRKLSADTASAMSKTFYEIVIAPDYDEEALTILTKKRDLRILSLGDDKGNNDGLEVRQVSGGILLQTQDTLTEYPGMWEVVSERKPTNEELTDMVFAWKTVKHIKSNAIVLVKGNMLVGMGAGQPNRVNSVHLAVKAAGDSSSGAVLASDAFFPFPDGLEAGAAGGVTAVIQPGGSIRDKEVIEAANKLGLAMMFTGVRHFRH